jgi:hypothetical protein
MQNSYFQEAVMGMFSYKFYLLNFLECMFSVKFSIIVWVMPFLLTVLFSLIRCWDVRSFHEKYRITAGLGGVGGGPNLCVWSLLSLRYPQPPSLPKE